MEISPAIEIFVNQKDSGEEAVALLLRDPSVVAMENDELAPGCLLSVKQARFLAGALLACAEQIDPPEHGYS